MVTPRAAVSQSVEPCSEEGRPPTWRFRTWDDFLSLCPLLGEQCFHVDDGACEQHPRQHRGLQQPPGARQRQGERVLLRPRGHVLLRCFLDWHHAGVHEVQAAGEEVQPAAAVQGRGAALGRGHEATAHGFGPEVGARAHDAEHAPGERGAGPGLHPLLHGRGQCQLRVLVSRRAPHHPGGGGRRRAGGDFGDAPQRKQRRLLGEHPPEFLALPGPLEVTPSASTLSESKATLQVSAFPFPGQLPLWRDPR